MWTRETYKQIVGQTIIFNAGVEDLEAYPEENMRARVLDVRLDHQPMSDEPDEPQNWVYILKVDYGDFDNYNRQFETYNYYDGNGTPCLNAREAGFYNKVDILYLPGPEAWHDYFSVENTSNHILIKRYNEENKGESYVRWLENQLLST